MTPRPESTRPPMLADALSVLLPHPVQASFLRACLLDGPDTREAWLDWMRAVGDPLAAIRRDELGLKPWLPLLLESARRRGALAGQEGLSVLRVAHFREELRTKTFRRLCGCVLGTLRDAGVPFVLVGGVALADTVYAAPTLRHCHDIDVLVEGSDIAKASAALAQVGFRPAPGVSRARTGEPCFRHDSGLCVELHTDLPGSRFFSLSMPDVWECCRVARVCDTRVNVLSPADSLVHVLGKVSAGPCRRKPCWILDVWHMMSGTPSVDWDRLSGLIDRAGMVLPTVVLLDHMAREFRAPVPQCALEHLRTSARAADRRERELALGAATAGGRIGIRRLIDAARTSRSRTFILRWLILPSASYLRQAHDGSSPSAMPLLYARRALSRLASLCTGGPHG